MKAKKVTKKMIVSAVEKMAIIANEKLDSAIDNGDTSKMKEYASKSSALKSVLSVLYASETDIEFFEATVKRVTG